VIWRAFLRSSSPSLNEAGWWRDAQAAADSVTTDAVRALRQSMAASAQSPDEAERQEEMIDGLEHLLTLAGGPLPVLDTQHRVIGTDVCHLAIPCGLVGDTETPGKLFLTSARLVFSGGRVQAWPWHRVRQIARAERALFVTTAGAGDEIQINCNSYGDALAAVHVAGRLRSAPVSRP